MNEIWVDISGYEGHYQISNIGRVKSLSRMIISPNGRGTRFMHELILKIPVDKGGYLRAPLTVNNVQKYFSIHRLVAQSFIPNLNNLPEVNHKNGIKSDNRIENLEWCDRSFNKRHSYRVLQEMPRCGLKNGMTKITESIIIEIRKNHSHSSATYNEIGAMYNISGTHVWRILKYKTWQHL